jgi:hypothetical protein
MVHQRAGLAGIAAAAPTEAAALKLAVTGTELFRWMERFRQAMIACDLLLGTYVEPSLPPSFQYLPLFLPIISHPPTQARL